MSKTPKAHKQVGEEFLATAKQSSVVHKYPFPPAMVWKALLDPVAWTEWLPITKVTWTSPQPFGVGTTRTVEIGQEIVHETFFGWEEGRRMAFRFEASTLPVSAAVEDYRLVGVDGGCEMHWTGKAAAPLVLGGIITGQLEKSLREGMPKLEKLIAADTARFS